MQPARSTPGAQPQRPPAALMLQTGLAIATTANEAGVNGRRSCMVGLNHLLNL